MESSPGAPASTEPINTDRNLIDEEEHDEIDSQSTVTPTGARELGLQPWCQPYQNLSLHQRLETFQGTSSIFSNPKHLARAGFFYDGYADAIRCFFCGGGLHSLKLPSDYSIYMLHSTHYPDCIYIQCLLRVMCNLLAGLYSSDELERNFETEGDKIINLLEEDVLQIHPSLLCRNCGVNRVCMMFLPCCHLLYCLDCGITSDRCYYCLNLVSHFILAFKSISQYCVNV
uniref:RING-type domain-containing protein n=1 Tax=Biomphalaria glabrata TaxID=6526 RepID=A0A2C9LB99_BIOGL